MPFEVYSSVSFYLYISIGFLGLLLYKFRYLQGDRGHAKIHLTFRYYIFCHLLAFSTDPYSYLEFVNQGLFGTIVNQVFHVSPEKISRIFNTRDCKTQVLALNLLTLCWALVI